MRYLIARRAASKAASKQSLGELALRVGITQQATGKLLRDLEFGGYACSAADHQDKRTRIIKLTAAGVALQRDLAAILQEIRGEYKSAEWGNQIRNYVLHPYTKVKDVRTGAETADAAGTACDDRDLPRQPIPHDDLLSGVIL